MKIEDENELFRLADMLKNIADKLDLDSPFHEGLEKGALALHLAFLHGNRLEIEKMYSDIGKPLFAEQMEHLDHLGLELKINKFDPTSIWPRKSRENATPLELDSNFFLASVPRNRTH